MIVRWLGRMAAVVALAAGLAGCAATPPQQQYQAQRQFQPQTVADFLVQTRWKLASWRLAGGGTVAVPAGDSSASRAVTLSFTRQAGVARYSGYSGCNEYSGLYTIANQQVIFKGTPVTTRMACLTPSASNLEQAYFGALGRIISTTADQYGNPQVLTFKLDTGDILTFSRLADPIAGGQPGQTKLVYVRSQKVTCLAGGLTTSCYEVRDSAGQPWQPWHGEIAGFDYQPGYVYRIRVMETPDPNPPLDGSSVRWTLQGIVEQRLAKQ